MFAWRFFYIASAHVNFCFPVGQEEWHAFVVARLVYIGGYGQSGSTLFEYLITASPDAVACGEIVNGFPKRDRGRKELKCSCGRLRNDCPVWSAFNQTSGTFSSWTHEALVMTLLEHIASKYAIMSDSSKTAWGSITAPFRLRRRLGQNLHLLHLVRDPRAVCWSAVRLAKLRKTKRWKTKPGKNWRLTKQVLSRPIPRCLRTVLGWWIANLSCEVFGWLYPGQYLRLHYENFASSPRVTLHTLFKVVSPDRDLRLTTVGINDNRHQLYGNRMRRQRLLFSDVRLDVRWKSEMPRAYRRLVGALSWPLRAKYGY